MQTTILRLHTQGSFSRDTKHRSVRQVLLPNLPHLFCVHMRMSLVNNRCET